MCNNTRFLGAALLIVAFCITAPAPAQAQNACSALGPKAISGALIGGLGGGALGAGLGAAAGGRRGAAIGGGVGLFGGMMAGLSAGKQADQRDCAAAQAALAQMTRQPVGVPATWRSPSGSYGSYTPTGPEYAQGNQFCRPVRQSTNIVGHQPVDSGVVTCRDANGDYQTVTETASNTGTSNTTNQ